MKREWRIWLAAYLENDLSPADRARVEQILKDSREAQAYLRALLDDAEQLRNLPQEALPRPLEMPTSRSTVPLRRPSNRTPRRRFPVWVSGIAAAILVTVGGISFWLYRVMDARLNGKPEVLASAPRPQLQESKPLALPEADQIARDNARRAEMARLRSGVNDWARLAVNSVNHLIVRTNELSAQLRDGLAYAVDVHQGRRWPRHEPLLAARWPQTLPAHRDGEPLPKAAEVELTALKGRAEEWLPLGELVELHLFSEVPMRTMVNLCNGFRAAGLPVGIDAELVGKRDREVRAPLLLYVENARHADLVKFLAAFEELETKQQPSSPVRLQVVGVGNAGRRHLARQLRVDVARLTPTKAVEISPNPTDPRQGEDRAILAKGALQHRVVQPTGVIFCHYALERPTDLSDELRRYLNVRKHPDVGTVNVVFVVRPK
jgi:hypothetical protein